MNSSIAFFAITESLLASSTPSIITTKSIECSWERYRVSVTSSTAIPRSLVFKTDRKNGLLVNGVTAHGCGFDRPKTCISAVRFWDRGREIPVPKKLYQYHFNPNFPKPEEGEIMFTKAKGGLKLKISCGDGAYGCNLWLSLNGSGHHSAKTEYL